MPQQVDYVAHMNWMWYDGKWIPERIAFAQVYKANIQNTLVVRLTLESLNHFSYRDVLKNLHVYPLDGFHTDDEDGSETYRVPMNKLEEYLGNEFYNTTLNDPDIGWDVTIGTHDWATFMFLEPLFPEKTVFFLGNRWEAQHMASTEAEKMVTGDWNILV